LATDGRYSDAQELCVNTLSGAIRPLPDGRGSADLQNRDREEAACALLSCDALLLRTVVEEEPNECMRCGGSELGR
jgi:hypothetical protein